MLDWKSRAFAIATENPRDAASSLHRIAMIGNFPPRRCGIATFTAHTHEALRAEHPEIGVDIYAMNEPGRDYNYPGAVAATIAQDDPASYRDAADRINRRGTDLVWVQHEFGIFGGPAGSHLIELLDAVTAPVAVTLHSVLDQPDEAQRAVMDQLAARASLFIVMARKAETILTRAYGVHPDRIRVIEHGVPDRVYVRPADMRQCIGQEERRTILTFGLLSPDKGIETMLRAMPHILDRCPDAVYRVVGATHPHLLAHEGEAYRDRLQALSRELGIERSVRWENDFLEEDALLDRIAAADIYVTPYRNPRQITSGTLAYASALGKPIVSTPYVHACELLTRDRGVIVDFDDSKAMANVVTRLLIDPQRREAMAEASYRHGRELTWRCSVRRAVAEMDASSSGTDRPARLSTPQDIELHAFGN
ncbi:glycosyltransferase family 4 protein [Stakelama marina]|uniref:Glycosyltransferase family 4 protein n=1 Tax=Stakelama marina TaxID=2826939 RepID=A0A8T4I968_9SPHN|nr:glycosyltransferase family 4 protein [Stakelama marina]MBR0551050.1 glycosyltransferase family 4 protein [Stakelama marina]